MINLIIIFIVAFCSNIVWSLYIKSVSQHRRLMSANYSIVLSICFLISLQFVINNIVADIVYLCGVWLGTYYHDDIENIFIKKNE